MSYQEKYHKWACQVAAIVHNKNEEQRRQNKTIVAVYINVCTAVYINKCTKFKKIYKKKRFWVDPLFERRHEHGFYYASVPGLTSENFRNYYRMTATQFEELLHT